VAARGAREVAADSPGVPPGAGAAGLATANGAFGVKVERPAGLREAVRRALAHPGPALLDVNVNPDEPPLPGKVEYEQAKKFAAAFLRGQPPPGVDRHHPVQGQDRAAPLVTVLPCSPASPARWPSRSGRRTASCATRISRAYAATRAHPTL
jgi:hypothetical protein